MSNINLTAPLQDRDLTAPLRNVISTTPTILTEVVNWVSDTPDFMITSDGDFIVFNNVTNPTAYPLELTAPLQDRDLTAPQRLG